MKSKHWHAMNGSRGCLPDSNEVCSTKQEAIDTLIERFSDVEHTGMRNGLKYNGIYYFLYPRQAGAEYAEVSPCREEECIDAKV